MIQELQPQTVMNLHLQLSYLSIHQPIRAMLLPPHMVASGSGPGSSSGASSRQQLRQRITRVNLRDFIFCLEQDRSTSRSLMLYKALLK
ncbi:hypothetical protein INR49_009475 [Caranx melampygus]|nr:hypothetical protein INR49_009475 [Caranx melampygus]